MSYLSLRLDPNVVSDAILTPIWTTMSTSSKTTLKTHQTSQKPVWIGIAHQAWKERNGTLKEAARETLWLEIVLIA